MSDLLNETVANVKANSNIADVIGGYIPLVKVGTKFLGLCPFHADRNPSLNVTPAIGIYKCFACGAGGDVIRFVQEYEKLGFFDALRSVAARAGVVLPASLSPSDEDSEREKYLDAQRLAARVYREHLENSPAALAYLTARGVTPEAREHFKLGLAPPHSGLFSGRLMFPIFDESGRVIAFGGRTLEPGGQPKYVNSPDSPYYHKGQVMYGPILPRSKMTSDRVVLVEGYLDVISLWQAGIHSVAASGTSLSDHQIAELGRSAGPLYLFFDGDDAGQKASRRYMEQLLATGLEVRVPRLAYSEDPDSYAFRHGAEGLERLFTRADDLVDFLVRFTDQPVASMSPESKYAFYKVVLEHLRRIPSQYVRYEYIEKLGRLLGVRVNK